MTGQLSFQNTGVELVNDRCGREVVEKLVLVVAVGQPGGPQGYGQLNQRG